MEMNEMTVYEIIEKKEDLERDIAKMIQDFNENVYKIHSVNVEWYDVTGCNRQYMVDVEVLV
jgi:hypothetical protein